MRTWLSDTNIDDTPWDKNPYYNPDSCDLSTIAVVSEPNMSYEFNITIIVKDNPTGKIFAVTDSGCSCPIPFEYIRGLGDMTELRNLEDFDNYFSDTRGYLIADVFAARRLLAGRLGV